MQTTTKSKKTYRKPLQRSGTNFGWQINTYEGCEHGCHYCYARKRPFNIIPYNKWINATPRLDTPNLLTKQLKGMRDATKDSIKDIFICSACDPYQPLESIFEITKDVIKLLIEYDLPFTILTKNAGVLRDIGLFKGYKKCRVGLTIITMDDNFRKVLEPDASPIQDRIDALEKLKSAGISTYCSVEPIMSDIRCDPIAIVDSLKDCVDLFEFGKWNPKFRNTVPVKYDEKWYMKTFTNLEAHCKKLGITYCHAGHSEKFLKANGFKFKPCPTVIP